MLRWIAVLFIVGLAGFCQSARAADIRLESFASPTLIAEVQLLRLDTRLGEAMDTGDFVGLGVAVVRGGEIRYLRTFGETEAGSGNAVTPDTVFRIASLSKGFASSMVGIAVAEGKLSLEAPVSGFAPELALPGAGEKSLTLSHILSQRTGLPPNAYDNLLEDGVAPASILPMYRKVKPTCKPADCYTYQNITYDLSGRALVRAYAEPFPDLVEERLFAPLGMRTASYGLEGLSQSASWARPHTRERPAEPGGLPGPWTAVEVKTPYYAAPAAGGVNASLRDMAQWLNAQLGHAPDVLAGDVLTLVHTPQVSTPTETQRMQDAMPALAASWYAYGWRVYDYSGRTLVAHGGSVDGYGAQIMFIPEMDTGIVVLANARARRMWGIAPTFVDLILGLPPRIEETPEDAVPAVAAAGPQAVP